MGARHRAAFLVVALTALALACGTFGTNEDPPIVDDEAGMDASMPVEAAVDQDAGPTCIPQSLDPPPPEDPKCGTNGAPFDLTKSDMHCGACNHSCLGTGCENGRCK